jgi:hypothetical protein
LLILGGDFFAGAPGKESWTAAGEAPFDLDEALAIPMLASSNYESKTDISSNQAGESQVCPPVHEILDEILHSKCDRI